MCCTRLAEIQDAKNRHLGTIAQLCRAVSSQSSYIIFLLSLVKIRPQSIIELLCFRPILSLTFSPFRSYSFGLLNVFKFSERF